MLRTIVVALILVPGIVAALRNRFAALGLYLWFALFRPQEWVWIDLAQFRLSLILGGLVVAPSLLGGAMPNLTHPVAICTLVFVVSSLIAQANAVSQALGWEWIDYMARLGVICLLVPSLVTTRRRFVLVVAIIAGSFGVHAASAGFFSLLGGGLRFGDGLAGAFIDNNGFAVGIVMVLPLLIVAAQNLSNRWIRMGFSLAVPLSAFAAISTFSRGGFLALVACAGTFVLLQKRRMAVLSLALPLVAVAAIVAPIPEGYGDRIRTIQTYDETGETSAVSRLHFWRVGLDMVIDNPFGIGLRNYEDTYDRYDSSDGDYGDHRSVHNSHLQALVEAGVPGGLAYLGLFVFAFLAAFRARRQSRETCLPEDQGRFLWTSANGIIAGLVGFVVGGSFIAMALNDLLWLIAALAATLEMLGTQMVADARREHVVPDAAVRARLVPAQASLAPAYEPVT